MRSQIRKFLTWLLLGALVLVILLGLGLFASPPAAAEIRQLEEAPGQIVYQSRQTLKDQHGNRWQSIAFKRIRPDGNSHFYLRLVGFPGVVSLDRTKPLTLTNSLGKTLTAVDASHDIFTDTVPEPSVGQYDLQPLLPQLQAEIPLVLKVPTPEDTVLVLNVSPSLIQEWKTLASYKVSVQEEEK